MLVAWDTETDLIRPAQLAPPLVCVTYAIDQEPAQIEHVSTCKNPLRSWLENPQAVIVGHNVAYDLAVVAAKFPELLPLIFAALDADRIADTQIRQQLLDIAAGIYRGKPVGNGVFVKFEYTLEALVKRCAGMELQKDAWRLSYGHFRDVPLDGWIKRAKEVQAAARADLDGIRAAIAAGEHGTDSEVRRNAGLKNKIADLESMIASDPSQCVVYPLDDARATMAVYKAQAQHEAWLSDQFRQVRAAFAAHLSSAWGLKTDENGVEILRKEVTEQLEEVRDSLIEEGLVRSDGTRDTKAAKLRMIEICRRDNLPIPRTAGHEAEGKCSRFAKPGEYIAVKKKVSKKGEAEVFVDVFLTAKGGEKASVPNGSDDCEEHVCLDAEACERSEDLVLLEYAELSTLTKVLGNDVEALAHGIMWPIHTRYGLAETGRTTSSKPNIQNWVRARKCKVCNGKGEIA